MPSFKLIPALLLTLPACVLDKDLGDTPGTTTAAPASSTGMTDPGDTTDPAVTTGEPTDPTGEPAALCPNSDKGDFSCTVPSGCLGFSCGGLKDLLDADGCPRPGCNDDKPCPAGQVCFDTGDWGTCNASGIFCEQMGDTCACGQDASCLDVAYCVPAEIGPPADCFAITDAAACLAAGCSEAPTVIPVALDGDTCVCGEPETACLWFTQDEWGSQASPGTFYELASGRVVVFPGTWIELPLGWMNCEDGGGPPACACAETCKN